MDAANVDLKGFTEEFYKKYTDSSLEPVLETLEYIKKRTSTWLEITTLLIPGVNDSEYELRTMTEWIVKTLGSDVPFFLQDRPAMATGRSVAKKNPLTFHPYWQTFGANEVEFAFEK